MNYNLKLPGKPKPAFFIRSKKVCYTVQLSYGNRTVLLAVLKGGKAVLLFKYRIEMGNICETTFNDYITYRFIRFQEKFGGMF